MSKWVVVDSYGVVIHRAPTLTACGVWIDPVLGIDFTGRAWGKVGELNVDADRFTKQPDGSYVVKMYDMGNESGGELTVRKATAEDA